jgi:CTP:phosphocholine cytidylyltransferase-like protein
MTIFETIVNTLRWLFWFCQTTTAKVKPVVVVVELDNINKIYEIDRYQEYERFRQELQLIKERMKERKKIREIMLS